MTDPGATTNAEIMSINHRGRAKDKVRSRWLVVLKA